MSLLSLKALPGNEYMLLTQTSELGEALLGSGLSFLLDNCPVNSGNFHCGIVGDM